MKLELRERPSFFFLAALCVVGCTQHWHYSQTFCRTYLEMWGACSKTLVAQGYTVEKDEQEQGKLTTKWKESLYPLRPGGRRTRVFLQIVKPEKVSCIFSPELYNIDGFYKTRLKVVREINHAPHDFMNPVNGVWLSDGHDPQAESSLMKAIESRLFLLKETGKRIKTGESDERNR